MGLLGSGHTELEICSLHIDLCICTELEIENGLFSGRFSSQNCNGSEKMKRFLEKFPNRAEYQLYYYGDSAGDREMLDIADRAFYKRFH